LKKSGSIEAPIVQAFRQPPIKFSALKKSGSIEARAELRRLWRCELFSALKKSGSIEAEAYPLSSFDPTIFRFEKKRLH